MALFFSILGRNENGANTHYGGQAVIEGVMMRGPDKVGVAIRKADGTITVKVDRVTSMTKKNRLLGLPLIRGALSLVESLALGLGALSFSAAEAGDESQQLTKRDIAMTMIVAVVFSVGLFIVIPTLLSAFIRGSVRVGQARASVIGLNLVEGAIRISFLLGYIACIGLIKDIRRVLAYHGAEHKVINAYEAGAPLTVEDARRFSTLHPRCGTSFLLFTAVVSIFLFSFFGWPGVIQRVVIRIALLPLVAGISYEMIRAAGKARGGIMSILSWPGLALQRMTTRKPDDSMLEVAIRALEAVLR